MNTTVSPLSQRCAYSKLNSVAFIHVRTSSIHNQNLCKYVRRCLSLHPNILISIMNSFIACAAVRICGCPIHDCTWSHRQLHPRSDSLLWRQSPQAVPPHQRHIPRVTHSKGQTHPILSTLTSRDCFEGDTDQAAPFIHPCTISRLIQPQAGK